MSARMTKAHFWMLARALHACRPKVDDAVALPQGEIEAKMQQWAECVGQICDMCVATNQLFSTEKFINACVEGKNE
jgi:hypothetical protein